MAELKSKRAPAVSSNERAWAQVYDDINDIVRAVNNKSGVDRLNTASGKDGDIRLFKDVDRTKYFIEGRFGDGWAKRELIFSDTSDAGQDETINFSSTESYVRPDGSVPFTGRQTGVSPQNVNELATKGYVDDNNTTYTNSWVDSGNNALLRLTPSSGSAQDLTFTAGNNIVLTPSGSSLTIAANVSTVVTSTFTTGTHSGVDLQSLLEDQDTTFAIRAGNNINITQTSLSGGDEYLQIDCAINTANFLASTVNRVAGVRSFDSGSIDWTQNAGAGGYITFDADGSNVAFSNVTVDSDNKPAVRITAPANTNYYLNGISKSGNTLTFSVTGAANQSYTFGSNAFTSTSYLTGITSTLATNESASPPRVSLLDDSSTIKALEEGSGISIEESATGGGNTVKISSTVNTSGLLTNGIVTVQDHDGGNVGNIANASGGDKLEFRDGGNITWNVSGPTSNVITVTGSVPNNTNYYLTGLSFSGGVLTGTVSGANDPSVNLDGRYLQGNQTITLSGDVSGSGTTSINVTVADDSHNHTIANVDNLQTSLNAKANLSGATFTGGVACNGNTANNPHLVVGGTGNIVNSSAVLQCKGFIRVAQYVLIHQTNSSSNAVGLSYANNNLSVYASSGTTAEGSGQANFHVPGDVIAYYSSDPRLKTNKKQLENSLSKLSNINGYTFDWLPKAKEYNSYNEGSDIGVMADEIEAMYPDLVETRANGYKAVKYEKLTAVLISAINELTNKLIEKGVLDSGIWDS